MFDLSFVLKTIIRGVAREAFWDDKFTKGWDQWELGKTRPLLPYLSLHDLSEDGNKLLGLMYYRTKHHPSDFAVADLHQLLPSWYRGDIAQATADGDVTVHGHRFGTVKTLDLEAVHRGDEFGAPKAQIVLRAQVKLITFLIEMATKILHDQALHV